VSRSSSNPDREYADELAGLGVEIDKDGGTIRVRAANDGLGAVVNLSVVGAQRLATMLGAAVVTAVHRGIPGGGTD
jgi:hypothetical protein